MPAVRYEFITLGKGGALSSGSPENVIRGDAPVAGTIEVTQTPTTANARPAVPRTGEWGQAVRFTATDGDALVTWGANPTVSATNSLLLVSGVSEVVMIEDGSLLSFMSAGVVVM